MRVSEYITYLVNGEVGKLAVSNVGDMSLNPVTPPTTVQLANQSKFIDYINLANLAIHKRFHIRQKELELDMPLDGEEFHLPANFLVPVAAYYAVDDEEVTIKDSYIKLVDNIDTAVSILIPEPFKAVIKGTDSKHRNKIILRYVAAPDKARKASTDLCVSEVYTEVILYYAAFKAHSAISGDMKDENNTHYLRYESSARQLVTSGMWGNNLIETNTKLTDNGFV